MPTYDYKCLDCGHTYELYQRISEDPIKVCPECQGNLKRLIGAGGTPIFKGSGFYQTDYKSKTTKPSVSSSSTDSTVSKTDNKK